MFKIQGWCLWNVMPFSLAELYCHYRGKSCVFRKGKKVSTAQQIIMRCLERRRKRIPLEL